MRLVFDLEADGLEDATKIWCGAFLDIDTGKTFVTRDLSKIVAAIKNNELLVGHNIMGYDIPLVEQLSGERFDTSAERVADTYEMSMMLNPNRQHSVEDWAARLGMEGKVKIDDWKNGPIELYEERAVQDVRIEYRIFLELLNEMGVSDWRELWVLREPG